MIILYYIYADISIDIFNKYIYADMCNMYIYADIELWYNIIVKRNEE